MLTSQRKAPNGATAGHFDAYSRRLSTLLATQDWSGAMDLADELVACWKTGRQVFLIGNGGAGGSAVHLANDFMYPISKRKGSGLRVQSLWFALAAEPQNAARAATLAAATARLPIGENPLLVILLERGLQKDRG